MRPATPDPSHLLRMLHSLARAAERLRDGREGAGLVFVPRPVRQQNGRVMEVSVIKVSKQEALARAA